MKPKIAVSIILVTVLFINVANPFFIIKNEIQSNREGQSNELIQFKGECKNIMAIGNATAGNYSLLLKVRDPARQGYQVLCSIPKGYEYDYHRPWTGIKMHFVVTHKFIGTTTKGDEPPNITKPGMLLSDAGLAFGDADTLCYLVNPTKYAWDDFDWMRYAAQSADNIEEAVSMLKNAVTKMHAPSVAENIFVAGANKGAIIEADAFNFKVRYIENGIEIQSNYPKMLWKEHILYPLFVASDFASNFTGWVKDRQKISIGSIIGIYITAINNNSIIVRMYPFGLWKEIYLGEGKPVGNFWVELKEIRDNEAKIFICYKYFMWEEKLKEIAMKKYGNIGLRDMMNWSRIHSADLQGLRGICQGGYEAATIYKIPSKYADLLSSLWFAADQCSSIFIPVHICDVDIYDAYENGESSAIALKLLQKYGSENLTKLCEKVEKDIISETQKVEEEAEQLIENGSKEEAIILLTLSDMKMQMNAIEIEKTWLNT